MTIKKILVFLACLTLLAAPVYATDYYPATSLTGGGTGALDAIDGSDLESGDVAIVTTSAATYHFRMDATSGAAESSPDVISPDANAGTKRWLLVGVLASTFEGSGGGTSINEFSTDDTLAGDSDDAVPTEQAVKAYVDGQIAAVAAISNFAGYVGRPRFEYKDTDEIYINPGRYEHNGTSQQMLYWTSQLTFQFGPGGSNADSSALAATDWFYLYIDDSAVSGATQTAAEFVAVTTAPTWSNTKHGWYNGNDRCVAAFRTNASSQVVYFIHDGGRYFAYGDSIEDRAYAVVTSGYASHTLTLPAFGVGTCGEVSVEFYDNASTTLYYRPTDSGVTTGQRIAYTSSSLHSFSMPLFTNASQQIDLNPSSAAYLGLYTLGYYFPRGM